MPSGLFDSLGASFGPIATYALAAIIVFVLLLVVLAVAKRALRPGAASANLRKGPRLAVIDVAAVDQRRKLVLVRRDEVEHLVLIGGQNDIVVEGGILRTPAPARQFSGERTGLPRFDPGLAPDGFAPEDRPAVVAPDPRPQFGGDETPRAASPLRRPLPSQPMQRRRAPAPELAADPVAAADPAPQEAPVARPAPLIEPAIVAEAAEPPVRQPPSPQPRPILHQPPEPVAPPRAEIPTIPVPDRPKRPETIDRPIAREAARETTATPPRHLAIPAFLQRSDLASEDVQEEEEARPNPKAEAVTPAPPQPPTPPPVIRFDREPVRQEPAIAPAPMNPRPAPVEPPFAARGPGAFVPFATPAVRPDGPASPMPPSPVQPTIAPSQPVAAPPPPPLVQPSVARPPVAAPPVIQPVVPPRPEPPVPDEEPVAASLPPAPSVEPIDDPDRRTPLSVRSFASAIQSRRSVPEPAPQPRAVPPVAEQRPQDRFRTTATPTYPVRETAPPVSAPNAPAPSTEDGGLDEALSRELDSNLGSLDWSGEGRTSAERPALAPAPAPQVEQPKPERKPTLEEEMEKLLSDFDFGPPRR